MDIRTRSGQPLADLGRGTSAESRRVGASIADFAEAEQLHPSAARSLRAFRSSAGPSAADSRPDGRQDRPVARGLAGQCWGESDGGAAADAGLDCVDQFSG